MVVHSGSQTQFHKRKESVTENDALKAIRLLRVMSLYRERCVNRGPSIALHGAGIFPYLG